VDYYDLNQEKYTTPEQVKARHILLKVEANASATEDEKIKEKAFELLKRITGGEDFISLAKTYSQDTSASEGGDLGFLRGVKWLNPSKNLLFRLRMAR